ncbi:hypothetical protein AVEN_108982-1 [Araneus ventricosus]|uniref:Uncharacterized protein n=1 Tax=Araneus ventricosus TaxID=182803 RepID=A0A4Y2F2L2_ARAVE|nr:hypothetical protein AVEN_108982-1 [Araneus ventricosus]
MQRSLDDVPVGKITSATHFPSQSDLDSPELVAPPCVVVRTLRRCEKRVREGRVILCGARWPNGKFGAGGFQVRNSPIPLKIHIVLSPLKHTYGTRRPVVWKFGDGLPAQVLFLSSDLTPP